MTMASCPTGLTLFRIAQRTVSVKGSRLMALNVNRSSQQNLLSVVIAFLCVKSSPKF